MTKGENEQELIPKQLQIMHVATKQALTISHRAVSVNGKALSMTKGKTELELIPFVEGGELLVLWQLHREGLGSAVELTTGNQFQSILKAHVCQKGSMAYARQCSLPVMWIPAWASPASHPRARPRTLQCSFEQSCTEVLTQEWVRRPAAGGDLADASWHCG